MAPPGFSEHPRLNRFLASCGLGSRRSVEQLIRAGRIQVNGTTVSRFDLRIAPGDIVQCDGRELHPPDAFVYLALNKPKGFETSHRPRGGRPSVFRLLPDEHSRLRYAGRLDVESRGLVLLSNDGSFVQAVSHPKHTLTKSYLVRLGGDFLAEEVRAHWLRGVSSDGELLRARTVHFREPDLVELELTEGRNRQIRRMASAVGLVVTDLYRFRIGGLDLESRSLRPGSFCDIRPGDVLPS